jgi:TRAP-type mannitol/chloroaromatic compound transport system permease large subunit
VRETAKVTSDGVCHPDRVQILNLVLISFGGEHYIQSFLRSFDNEMTVFLIVMLVLFILGFVLDFLEIIYIVVPIVGPVIYGGTMDPSWVTIMITVNLQTSFLTPPFGFALFYLRGVAPKEVTTGHIYSGIIPFVAIQVLTLLHPVDVPLDRDHRAPTRPPVCAPMAASCAASSVARARRIAVSAPGGATVTQRLPPPMSSSLRTSKPRLPA